MTESFDMESEYKLIADADFAADWVRQEVKNSVEWFDKQIHSGCVCDCEKNYGKGCLNPEKYLSGGCK